jgi:hypothetical protein
VANIALRLFDTLKPGRSPAAIKRAIAEYQREAAEASDAAQLVSATLGVLARAFDAELAVVFLRDKRGRQVKQGSLQTVSGAAIPHSDLVVEDAISGREEICVEVHGRSVLASPLLKGTQVGGVLYCQSAPGAPAWGEEDKLRLRTISSRAARALHALDWAMVTQS